MTSIAPLTNPTPAQQAAIDTVKELSQTQAAELALRHFLTERTLARADLLTKAWRALHRTYRGGEHRGIAPTTVSVPIVRAFFSIKGDAPDVGEATRWSPSPDDAHAWSLGDEWTPGQGGY